MLQAELWLESAVQPRASSSPLAALLAPSGLGAGRPARADAAAQLCCPWDWGGGRRHLA